MYCDRFTRCSRQKIGVLLVGGALALLPSIGRAEGTLTPDSGKFIVTMGEAPLATETFTSDAEGNSTCEIIADANGTKVTNHITVKAEKGRLKQVVASAQPGGKFTLDVDGTKGKLTIDAKPPQVKDVTLPERLYPFSPVAPHQIASLIAAYDASRGGPQKFNIVFTHTLLPTGLYQMSVTLTSNGARPRKVAGKTIPVSRYTLALSTQVGPIESEALTDTQGRLLLWNLPLQKLVAVRDGYQDLTQPDVPIDPLLSKPTYTVKQENDVKIPMRDGVKLAADVFRPDAPGKFPVILERTPYDRHNVADATFYARRGYVVISQDVRGKFGSEGAWQPFVNEARDGYDSVEWCASQPWSDGKVGMIGASYGGFVQWAAARENSPHLKCLIPIVSPPDPLFNIPYAYGPFFLYGAAWWSRIVEGKEMTMPDTVKNLDGFKTLPLTDVDKSLFGHHIDFFQEWLKHPTDDDYWKQVDFNTRMKTMGPLPALHVSGWFDGDGIGTKRNYAAMVASGHANQRLVYGPWSHAVNSSSKLAGLDFGPQSLRDLDTLYLRWFDHWLKGVQNGVDKDKPVDAFLMGANKWRTFTAWPPKEARMTKWYLHSAGHANSDKTDGTLSPQAPSASEKADHYTYDPAHPFIPTAFAKVLASGKLEDSVAMQTPESDPNLLAYVSEPLAKDLVVAGPISLHLVAATSARDTDWFATLADVYPDGKVLGLCDGIIRARFRNSFETPTLLQPGAVAEYTLDLWATGNVFKKGHRLRVVVTSSCFPIYERNLNTGADNATTTAMVTAHQTVYHDNLHTSYILLPTLPD